MYPAPKVARTRIRCISSVSSDRGFTFIELIASLALMAILTAIFGMGLVAAIEGYDFSRTNSQIAQKGHLAMARMMRELSELTNIVSIDEGSNPSIIYERVQLVNGIPTVRTLALQFYAAERNLLLYTDLPSGTTSLDPTDGDVLADDVQLFDLQYYQGPNPLAWQFSLPLLSTIEISLSLNRPDAPDRPQEFSTLVHMRNTNNDGGAAAP